MASLIIKEEDKETIYKLIQDITTLGRSRTNNIKLATEDASRKHCQIVKTPIGYKISDLKSSNGTYVNGVKISEKELVDGDKIQIGQIKILFIAIESSKEIEKKDKLRLMKSITTLNSIKDDRVQILLDTMSLYTALMSFEDYLSHVIDSVVSITNAERGILFLNENDGKGEPKIKIVRNNFQETLKEITDFSRGILKQVREEGKPICLLDVGANKETPGTPSMKLYQLRTVMCAPLISNKQIYGFIYVDNKVPTQEEEFTKDDLALFEATTKYLALVIENAKLTEDLVKKEEALRISLEKENLRLKRALEKQAHIIGECTHMQAIYETIKKAAPTDATILIIGESGTGKEAVAHTIHDMSNRHQALFVVVDCASIPETLLESELFGHEKGAFTGAIAKKLGKFELANGGTLFLDEIGEMPLTLQVKLLRTIQEKEITPVGSTKTIKIDVRIITATNKNPEEMVSKNLFRQDLFYRLNVITIQLPPLRERSNDIPLLAKHFLQEANIANGRNIEGFTKDAEDALFKHKWPGNVRELKHRIEQAVILAETDKLQITSEDLGLTKATADFSSFEDAHTKFEKQFIQGSLAKNDYNISRTARALNISRQYLQTLVKKHGIAKAVD